MQSNKWWNQIYFQVKSDALTFICMWSPLKKYSLAAIAEALISECEDFPQFCASQSSGASQFINSQVGLGSESTGSYGWKRKSRKMPPDWLLDQLLCLNSLGGLLTSLASNPTTPPPTFFFFLHPLHTHRWAHTCLTSHPWRLAVCLHQGIYTPLRTGQLVSLWSRPHHWPASRGLFGIPDDCRKGLKACT